MVNVCTFWLPSIWTFCLFRVGVEVRDLTAGAGDLSTPQKLKVWEFLGGLVVRIWAVTAVARVQFLDGELRRSRKPRGMAKKKKKEQEEAEDPTLPTKDSFVVRCENSTRQLLSLVLNFETDILKNLFQCKSALD